MKFRGSDGTTLWSARTHRGEEDYANALALTADGDVVVTGGDHKFLTVRYSGVDGQERWSVVYDAPQVIRESAQALAVSRDGEVFVTGFAGSQLTLKYDSNGTNLWTRFQPGLPSGTSIALDARADAYVTTSRFDLLKYRNDGTLQWLRPSLNPVNRVAADLAFGTSGDVFVVGSTPTPTGNRDLLLARFSSDTGTLQQEVLFDAGLRLDETPVSIDVLPDGGLRIGAQIAATAGPRAAVIAFQPPVFANGFE